MGHLSKYINAFFSYAMGDRDASWLWPPVKSQRIMLLKALRTSSGLLQSNLGLCHSALGQQNKAQIYFRKAIHAEPGIKP